MKKSEEILGYLNGEKSYLISLKPDFLFNNILSMLDFLQNKRKWSCLYICTNKPSEEIRKKLNKNKFDLKKFYFIDTVQKNAFDNMSNVSYLSSSGELTKIIMIITQLSQINQNHGFVVVDSLDGFALDNDENILARFIRSLVASTTKYNSKILLITSGGVNEKLLNTIKPFFDKIINIK